LTNLYISVIVIYDTNIQKRRRVRMELSYIRRTFLSLIILGLSLVIVLYRGPNLFSIVGGIVGFLIFSYNFKKIVSPIIFLVVLLLPMTFSTLPYFGKIYIPFTRFSIPFNSRGVDFSHVEEPTISIPSAKDISIDGPGFIVEFKKDYDGIKVPNGVKVKRFGDKIEMSIGPSFDMRNTFDLKHIFKGRAISAKKIVIGTNSNIDTLSIDTMGVRVSGYINAKNISIDGMGIMVSGTLNIDTLKADGMGIKIEAKVIKAPSIEIDGMGADLELDYIEPWEGDWYLSVSGMGAKIRYRLPPNNSGKLKINREGLGGVVERYGDTNR